MARPKKTIDASETDATQSSMVAGMVAGLKNAKDIADFNVGGMFSQEVGIPLPSIALRYLFQSTCIPLSKIIQIAGEEGSAKSAFLNEMANWILTFKGLYVYAENENKDTRNLRSSILGWDPLKTQNIIETATTDMQEWQTFMTRNILNAKNIQTAKGGIGRTVPVMFAVDSLTGTPLKEQVEEVEADGSAKIGYPVMANVLAKYFRTMPKQIADYPFWFVATNHAKPGSTPQGLPTVNIPGGKSIKFMETLEIQMSRVRDINKMTAKGLTVRFKTNKNSMGPGRKTIEADLLWTIGEDATGNFRQYTAWDWHTAAIKLLASFDTEAYMRNAIREITDIRITKASACLATSELLGAVEPISYYEMSQRLEQRPDILSKLYKLLHITPTAEFETGKCFKQQRAEAQKAAAAVVASRYAMTSLLPAMSGDELTDEDKAGE